MLRQALESLAPLIAGLCALGLFAAALALALNIFGRRLERHERLLARLELRVDNLHRDHRPPAVVRVVPALRRPGEPPTLSEADTLEITDDMLEDITRTPRRRR